MTLHVFREGEGVPLVLLHGFPLDHRMWLAVAAGLPGDHPVLAMDLPGTPGHADDLPEPSIEASADAVATAMAEAGIGRAVVAGMSMGGYVALALTERHPDLVAALALVDTKSTADAPEARANRLRIADEAERDDTVAPVRPMSGTLVGATTRATRPAVGAQIAEWIEDQVPAGIAWSQRAMAARPDRGDVLARFTGPVTVVVGDEDELTPPAGAEQLAALAHARLVVVPHAGHMAATEQPDDVAAALADLVQRAESHRG